MAAIKRIPQRKCVGCGVSKNKSDLIRVVRSPENETPENVIPENDPPCRGGYHPPDEIKHITDHTIDGLDIIKGLEKLEHDESAYLKVLHSYITGTRTLLGTIKDCNEDNLQEYTVSIHGIKGASNDLFAGKIGEQAKLLEDAAKAGDIEYINKHNPAFLKMACAFMDELDDFISSILSQDQKPVKGKPDPVLLSNLLIACNSFSIYEIDSIMEELESYRYSSDDGLVDWLRSMVDVMKLKEIVERLKGMDL